MEQVPPNSASLHTQVESSEQAEILEYVNLTILILKVFFARPQTTPTFSFVHRLSGNLVSIGLILSQFAVQVACPPFYFGMLGISASSLHTSSFIIVLLSSLSFATNS